MMERFKFRPGAIARNVPNSTCNGLTGNGARKVQVPSPRGTREFEHPDDDWGHEPSALVGPANAVSNALNLFALHRNPAQSFATRLTRSLPNTAALAYMAGVAWGVDEMDRLQPEPFSTHLWGVILGAVFTWLFVWGAVQIAREFLGWLRAPRRDDNEGAGY